MNDTQLLALWAMFLVGVFGSGLAVLIAAELDGRLRRAVLGVAVFLVVAFVGPPTWRLWVSGVFG